MYRNDEGRMVAAADETVTCNAATGVHYIDRRKPLVNNETGAQEMNWQCVCRKLFGDAARWRGGEFHFVELDADAKPKRSSKVETNA